MTVNLIYSVRINNVMQTVFQTKKNFRGKIPNPHGCCPPDPWCQSNTNSSAQSLGSSFQGNLTKNTSVSTSWDCTNRYIQWSSIDRKPATLLNRRLLIVNQVWLPSNQAYNMADKADSLVQIDNPWQYPPINGSLPATNQTCHGTISEILEICFYCEWLTVAPKNALPDHTLPNPPDIWSHYHSIIRFME